MLLHVLGREHTDRRWDSLALRVNLSVANVSAFTSLVQPFEECGKVIWSGVGSPTPDIGGANVVEVRRYQRVPRQSARFLVLSHRYSLDIGTTWSPDRAAEIVFGQRTS
jgi:hypothetical protein